MFSYPSRITWGNSGYDKKPLERREEAWKKLLCVEAIKIEVRKQNSQDGTRNRKVFLQRSSKKPENQGELWDKEPAKSATKLAVRRLKTQRREQRVNPLEYQTQRQEWRPRSMSDGTQSISRGNDNNILWPLRSLFQKCQKHQKRKGPSRSEHIPLVTVHIVHGWESSESKYPRCWDTPCKTKHQCADANRARGRVKTLWEEKPPCQQPQEGLR